MTARPRFLVVSPTVEGGPSGEADGGVPHGGRRYRDLAESVLSAEGEVVHLALPSGSTLEERTELLDAALLDADALVMTPWLLLIGFELPPFDAARFERAKALRVVAGTHDFRLGWVDLEEAARRRVTVVDTSRTMTPTVAEFGVAITLSLLRNIPGAVETVRRGGWIRGMDGVEGDGFMFRDLADCRVGLAGYGTINRHYRRFILPYGCEVRAYDPWVRDEVFERHSVVGMGSLRELAEGSDVLVVAIPPTPATLGVIDAAVIDALAPGSLFVLLSRMAVVEQEALWRRVRAGELKAAIDVFDPEPPPADAWFRSAPNVLPTPHMAGNVRYAHERCFLEACADAARVVRGEAPHHPASPRDKMLYEGALDRSLGT